ncbi:MAG TPA: hypothetical protein VNY05_14170 [Candidatus Acidoferrales bacterium]|jgi:hypothetical protein|nr:hypothetical protein [Candidatus Acidoferrales bacterium]
MKATQARRVAAESGTRRLPLAALALCGVTALAYSNSFQAGFALDNKTLLLRDARIREASGANVALIFQHSYWWPYGESGLYRPITTLSYLFNYAILGDGNRPAGYHWVNLLLHLGNALLVYALALRLIRQFWPSVFVAGVWALHPVLTESVTNIVGRADLLAAMAVLSGLLIYLKSREGETARGQVDWRVGGRVGGRVDWLVGGRVGWLVGLAAVTTLGLLSKESAVSLVGLVVLYELAFGGAARPGWLAVLLPALAVWRWRAVVLAGSGPVEFPFWDNPLTGAGFWTARATAVRIMERYLWLTVWPQRLSCDYSYSEIGLARGSIEDWIGWLIVAAVVAVVAILFRRNRTAFYFASFAFVAFLPTANLMFPIGTIMAERFLYLPAVGLVACLVLAVYGASRRVGLAAAAPAILCLIAAGFGIRTWVRNLDWRDDLTMATAAVRTSPNSFKTHYLLSQALYESDPSHSQLDGAIHEGESSIAILDRLPASLNFAAPYQWGGECYLLKGDRLGGSPESERAYRRSLQFLLQCVSITKASHGASNGAANAASNEETQGSADLYRVLSACYLRLADTRQALEAGNHALRLEPLKPELYRQIADVLVGAGRGDEAAVKLLEGVILTGDSGLGDKLLQLYRSGLDSQGCATVPSPRGPALNPDCGMVHNHFCRAAADAVRVDLQIGRGGHALETRRAAGERFHCAEPKQ